VAGWGGYGEGNDSLGYDFEYHDMSRTLTGDASVQRCLIEVKSTAQEGTGAFEMTTNEWETAIRCHAGGEKAMLGVPALTATLKASFPWSRVQPVPTI
jgi:Domain of unknown function (DUF3883)